MPSTYDHSSWKPEGPVRSPEHKPRSMFRGRDAAAHRPRVLFRGSWLTSVKTARRLTVRRWPAVSNDLATLFPIFFFLFSHNRDISIPSIFFLLATTMRPAHRSSCRPPPPARSSPLPLLYPRLIPSPTLPSCPLFSPNLVLKVPFFA